MNGEVPATPVGVEVAGVDHLPDQVLILYAGTRGHLDKIPRPLVAAWEEQFLRFMREQRGEIRNRLIKEKKLTKEIEKDLTAAIEFFQPQFQG